MMTSTIFGLAEYFDVWNSNFNKLKAFLNENKELPLSGSTNEYEKSLASWFSNQTYEYKNMTRSNEEQYTIWSNFLREYADYFDVWNSNFNKLKAFLNDNEKTPSCSSKNEYERCLASWLSNQNQNYENRTHRMGDDIPLCPCTTSWQT